MRRSLPLILGGLALALFAVAAAVTISWQQGLLERWNISRSTFPIRFPAASTPVPAANIGSTSTPSPSASPSTASPTPPPTSTPTPTATPSPTPTPAEPSGCIVFDSYAGNNWDVYRMNPDGSGRVSLTNHAADDGDPIWSPDGQHIAFDSDRDGNWEVYVMNADGSEATRLTYHTADDDRPTWLPDGQHVAFESDRDGSREVYVVGLDDLGLTNFTNHPADDQLPAWSPDGQRVALASDRSGNWEIYRVNADGSGIVNLTNHPAEDAFPSWSPDGQRIVFHSYRTGDAEIYLMDADGSDLTRLTHQRGDDWAPSWSPDGAWIAFVSERDGNYEIYIMRTDGSDARRLTNNSVRDTWPHWSHGSCDGPALAQAPSTSSPVTTCPLPVDFQLARAWNPGQLGCPADPVRVTWAAWEDFQQGSMFWRYDTDSSYVLFGPASSSLLDRHWEQVPEAWKWDQSNPDGVGMTPPPGLFEPKRGFGWLWRNFFDAADGPLGWATEAEQGFCAAIQPFDKGFLLRSDGSTPSCEGNLYNWAFHPSFTPLLLAFFDDGTWQQYSVTQ